MKKFILAALTGIALALSSNAFAAAYCSGPISHTLTYASGDVLILSSWRSTWTQVCNVKQEWKGVTPEVCYLWFSKISSAITEDKSMTVYYAGIEQSECATMPTYGGAPAPGYMLLTK